MKIIIKSNKYAGLLLAMFWLCLKCAALAQTPQDNWYLEQTWVKTNATLNATNGGLSSPYGVAIGPDGRIYVGDQGYGRIQVYLPDGTFSFSITNGFGGGLRFSQPRGMITDNAGNLYVADYGTNCVFMFTGNGTFVRKFGNGTGSGNGQLNGVIDVAVSSAGEVYVLETGLFQSNYVCYSHVYVTFVEPGNARVSVFNADGSFEKTLLGPGSLDGQLQSPASIAISPGGKLFIAQNYTSFGLWGSTDFFYVKAFDTNGVFACKFSQYSKASQYLFGPSSLRIDRSGLLHVILGMSGGQDDCVHYVNPWTILSDNLISWNVFDLDGSPIATYTIGFGGVSDIRWPCHDIGPDGTMIISGYTNKTLKVYKYALREQWAPPRNAIPMPAVLGHQQRPNSPLVDIDYQVTDLDNTNVYAAMMVFTNATQSLTNCIRQLTFAEGTVTNLGPGIAANQIHRVTWNAGADWSVNLGNYRVAILAKDNRQGLLDIHYITLPPDRGLPTLKISSSPLIPSDFMQVWWWLLATNDPGITLASGKIYGVGGAFDAKMLCNGDYNTTSDGRAYIYGKMNVREATAQEVQWAMQGAVSGNTNQWTPTRVVGGRPKAVNEYGFDTGNWGTNAWWVVPQN